MKKHILGLTVFSFIVFAAVFVYGIFDHTDVAPAVVPQNIPAEKTYCKFKRETIQLQTVRQAVYKVKTNTIIWQGNMPDRDNLTYFHFWVVDKAGLKYLGAVSAESVLRGNKIRDFDGRSLNLDKLPKSANLYMVPDTFAQSSSEVVEYHPKFGKVRAISVPNFDKEKAISVTVDYGE